MFLKKIVDGVLRIFNFFTLKTKNSVYVDIGLSSKNNCEDIINNDGNNTLKFLSEFIDKKFGNTVTVYLEYFADDRVTEYKKIAERVKQNNVKLILLRDHADKSGMTKVRLLLKKYRCLFKSKIILVGTGDSFFYGKLKKQCLFDMNYFITCKNDFLVGENFRWKHLDRILTTSLLHSTAVSAQTGVKFDNCVELGFPRNDTLFVQHREEEILAWISGEIGFCPEKIIIYAPTYRDYEKNKPNAEERFLFGYDMPELEKYLTDNRYCMIYKAHNLQNDSILKYPKGVINFKICYEFSFYDLMSVADCVITDYSSLGYDFMLTGRIIFYNLFDLNKYIEDRGLSYSPYGEFCPGAVVKNAAEMMEELNNLSKGIDNYKEKRERLLKIFHKYPDNHSCERVIEYFAENFGLTYEHS